ncbi:hypothetical protein NM208_g2696 [Fusarium decemcellulare]|uniref:Uncharacterized protein n=2 Tax=Fusarium decemcellulare TaxID=57161 RepID=A0ACC1SIU2_9HYPO|nr:hypothetical protein NM208_g4979 [Fusarium decemcellulare]KAJ3545079.1 hypothetical protein NM208_g2696 [Fusarium decemcellulare]
MTLFSLYIAKVRWVNPSTESLNGLQFAAKGHETLILVSLGDILLHQMSSGLKRQDVGVPLGFLSSALNLPAPSRYLISRQLWAPTMQSGKTARYRRATAAMILLISVLCLAASPLSAIAMIPRQNWWKDDHYDPTFSFVPQFEPTQWIPHMQYRTSLDSESGPYLRDIIDPSTIPLHTLLRADSYTLGTHGPEFQNISYSNFNSSFYSYISTADFGLPTISTSPLSFVASELGKASSRDVKEETIPWITSSNQQAKETGTQKSWKQPLVAVQCHGGSVQNETELNFTFDHWFSDELLKNFQVSLSLNDSSAFSDLHHSNSTGYRFLDLQENKGWVVSANILFATTAQVGNDDEPERHYTLCLIFARWAEANTWIELPSASRTLSHLKTPVSESFSKNSSDVIYMDNKWLDGISSFSNRSFFESIADFCVSDVKRNCQERYLGLHITDAISQAGNNISWPNYSAGITPSDDATQDKITYTRYFYTYAYRFESSRGILLAFSFLLLHVLLVLIHLIAILVSKDPWQGSDWDNFRDMLVLALASKPPDGVNDLAQQSSKSELWMKTVTVDRNGDEGYSQIRLREEKEYQRTCQREEESGRDSC